MAVLIAVTFSATLAVASQIAGEVFAQDMGNMTGGNMTGGNWTTSSNMTS